MDPRSDRGPAGGSGPAADQGATTPALDPDHDAAAAQELEPDHEAAAAQELEPDLGGPPVLDEANLEGLLFVAERPLSRREIANLAGVSRAEVDARLGDLEVTLRGRGVRLVTSGERVELATAPEASALITRYLGVDSVRLSPAALETLAIVAYRQPMTRATLERIRGVDSDYTLRTLVHRRLVVELGRSEAPGRPILYGTGFEFLERFGLTSLEELPVLDAEVAARLADPEVLGYPAEADAPEAPQALRAAGDGPGSQRGGR